MAEDAAGKKEMEVPSSWAEHSLEEGWEIYRDDSEDRTIPEEFTIEQRIQLQELLYPPLFLAFNSLPPKIRAKVWFFALPSPRVLEIGKAGKHLILQDPLLQTCMETRCYFMKHYRPLLQLNFEAQEPSCRWIDPSSDVLLLDLSVTTLDGYVGPGTKLVSHDVKHLALSHYEYLLHQSCLENAYFSLLRFRRLKNIYIVACDINEGGQDSKPELFQPFNLPPEDWPFPVTADDVDMLVADEAVGCQGLALRDLGALQLLRASLDMLLKEDLQDFDGRFASGNLGGWWKKPEIFVVGIRRV